jgi:hypothetical protein
LPLWLWNDAILTSVITYENTQRLGGGYLIVLKTRDERKGRGSSDSSILRRFMSVKVQ